MSAKRLHPIASSKLKRMCCDEHREDFRKDRLGDDEQDSKTPAFGHIKDRPKVSAATPPTCSRTCKTCAGQYRPLAWQKWDWLAYDHAWNDKKAADFVKGHIDSTSQALEYLKEKLELHANAIAKRWLKRSASKRAEVLRAVMPDMHKNKYAPADLLYKLLRQDRTNEVYFKDYHDQWSLPYLDVASLSENPTRLLSLLYHRTRYTQADWALSDRRQLQIAFTEGALYIAYNPHCVVMHGKHFGKLVQWNEVSAHRGDMVGFPVAEVTLEAQRLLATFLRGVVELLLENGEPAKGNDKWLALVTSGFVNHQPPQTQSLLMHCTAPFGRPPRIDMTEILAKLEERMYTAEDALWCTQTVPDTVRQLLNRVKGSAWYQAQTQENQPKQLVRTTLGHFVRLEQFKALVYHARHAFFVHERYRTAIKRSDRLPNAYLVALQLLLAPLRRLYAGQVSDLLGLATSLPTFRRYYKMDLTGAPEVRVTAEEAYRDDPLFWCIYQLHHRDAAFDTTFLFGCIDSMLSRTSGKAVANMDELLICHLSDMAAVHSVLSDLESNRDVSRTSLTRRECLALCETRLDWPDFDMREAAIAAVVEVMSDWLAESLEKMQAKPSAARQPSADHIVHFDLSNKALRDFWFRVESSMEVTLRDTFVLAADKVERYSEVLTWRHPEYMLALTRARKELELAVEAEARADRRRSTTDVAAAETVAFSQTIWGEEKRAVVRATPLKEKIKTRALSTPTNAPTEQAPEPVANETIDSPRIAVSASSLELFTRMFTPSASTKQHASVDWTDLVAAFADAGCSWRQGPGSAEVFLCEGAGFGSVTVHKPHPNPSVNPIAFRGIGKKVQQRLGWDAQTFVLRERGGIEARRNSDC